MTSDQKKNLLNAKIAVALQNELGRAPKRSDAQSATRRSEKNGCEKIFTDTARGTKAEYRK